ncbi:zf-RING-2 multi-domain protein [Pyrenophora tritici-repentis]|nr:zf-RING-2 multi-domain protein [Pyrenophora tritici-repentis]KAI0604872.1 zf-RING-2 multi-domain protein [Pyrenophora tritici-repentis]
MTLPTRSQFYRDYLQPLRILPGAPQYADISICVVCQEDFNEASYDMVSIQDCNHIFHRKCLIEWAESASPQRDACPSCRKTLFRYAPLTNRQRYEVMQEELEETFFAPDSRRRMQWRVVEEMSEMAAMFASEALHDQSRQILPGRGSVAHAQIQPFYRASIWSVDYVPEEPEFSRRPPLWYSDSQRPSTSPEHSPVPRASSEYSPRLPESEPEPHVPPPTSQIPVWSSAALPQVFIPTPTSRGHIGSLSQIPLYSVEEEPTHTPPTNPDNVTRLAHLQDFMTTNFTVSHVFCGVHTIQRIFDSYIIEFETGENHRVHGALGYVMARDTAIFYE